MVSFHLHYTLTRRQRLAPHLMPWLPCLGASIGFTFGIAFLSTVVSPWFSPLLVLPVVVCRRFFALLYDVGFRPPPTVELAVDDEMMEVTAGPDHGRLPLDGIVQVFRAEDGTWTVLHLNGSVVTIPAAAITDAQLDYLKGFARRAAARRKAPAPS
jgi:hypothetical protein